MALLLFAPRAGAGNSSAATGARPAADASPKIGHIRRPFNDGCGCTLQLPQHRRSRADDRYVFLSDMGHQAQMNIDGRDVMLRLVSRSPAGDTPKVGTRSADEFEAEGVKVKIDYVATKVCGPREEGCETTSYAATVAVTKRGRTRTLKASGLCGC